MTTAPAEHCPTCGSPSPTRHPFLDGTYSPLADESLPCFDAWHGLLSPKWERLRPAAPQFCPTCASENRGVMNLAYLGTTCMDPWHDGYLDPAYQDLRDAQEYLNRMHRAAVSEGVGRDVASLRTEPVTPSLTVGTLLERAYVLVQEMAAAVGQADTRFQDLQGIIEQQTAPDSTVFFDPTTAGETYLQDALRRLHAAIAIVTGPECVHEWTTFSGPVVAGDLCLRCMAIRATPVEATP